MLVQYILLMRVHQWIKNTIILQVLFLVISSLIQKQYLEVSLRFYFFQLSLAVSM